MLARDVTAAKARGDQVGVFAAKNRRALALDLADELEQLADGPDRYELPWKARERVKLALVEALQAVSDP